MRSILRIIFLSIIALIYTTARSQQRVIDSMLTAWDTKTASRPAEMLYIQTSKGVYETGEDLWFKIYLMQPHSMAISDLSRTVYIQMRADQVNDSIVWQEKYLADSGFVAGHIYVDEKLSSGGYTIRAYTSNSVGNASSIIASRRVQIITSINQQSAHKDTHKSDSSKNDTIRFDILPEGGNMVVGLRSTLAFKASDADGKPVDFEGAIYQNGELAIPIRSSHNGMGRVDFCPQADADYFVKLTNGTTYPMPKIKAQGMVMNLSKRDRSFLYFTIRKSLNLPPQPITLRSQMRGVVYSIAQAELTDTLLIRIPISNFEYQGVAEFTLLDSQFRPVAERLAYLNESKKLNIAIQPAKSRLATREKTEIKIKVTDQTGVPVSAHLSLSIFDRGFAAPVGDENIISYSYLRSDVRGAIDKPSLYFDPAQKNRAEALDLLLLTQGWRRYVWDLDNEATDAQRLTLSDHIDGIQTATMPKKKGKHETNPSSDQLVKAFGPNGNSMLAWTDSTGSFEIDTEMMKQLRGGYIYLKPMLGKEFKPELTIYDPFESINEWMRAYRDDFPSTFEPIKERDAKVKIAAGYSLDSIVSLDNVVVTAKGARLFRDKFLGRLDSLLQLELGPWVCAHNYLENWRDGYTHHHNPEYCPCPSDPGTRSKPVIGRTYSVLKPEYYECNKRGGWCFIPKHSGKVIYDGFDYTEEELLRRNGLWKTKGYYGAREFYQVDQTDIELSTPDSRNTLLWAPSVKTNSSGEASVSFYCSDINEIFDIVVEATDGQGLLGNGRSEFRVMRDITK